MRRWRFFLLFFLLVVFLVLCRLLEKETRKEPHRLQSYDNGRALFRQNQMHPVDQSVGRCQREWVDDEQDTSWVSALFRLAVVFRSCRDRETVISTINRDGVASR
ncbi:hypothetical protein B0J15DRAFT_64068 [Fusarium solani]|uniref:Secreted protein n=1 Tax=Fusarium solani TaxID=169388 RepID=A0A9P9K862_FUSSL|nr:uncharacterized protein B0J15DRAFT_64068 [Fusarium solani]KAH7247751.1 hypothetical protein B0J15DRAFT_64068 [Fusarium solani]